MKYNDWKLASPPENDMVSPCCGDDYEEITDEPEEETEYEYYICDKCKDTFDEPEEESEYNERMRENALEERADAKRKYNE